MSKITKAMVQNFICKVENKALMSIDDKYYKLMQEEKKAFIATKPEVDEAIKQAQDHLNALVESIGYITNNLPKQNYGWGLARFRERAATLEVDSEGKITRIPISIREHVMESLVLNDNTSIEDLKAAGRAESQEVRTAYATVAKAAKGMTPAKAVKYLEGVGFDVSWFNKTPEEEVLPEVDTSKLFVCGERG